MDRARVLRDLPMLHGSGQTELLLLSTASGSIRFGATALSEDEPRPAGGLTEREHGPTAARAYAIPGDAGPSAVKLFTLEGAPVAGALRALGPGVDLGSTAGAVEAAEAWVLLPASAQIPRGPGSRARERWRRRRRGDGRALAPSRGHGAPRRHGPGPRARRGRRATGPWASAPGSALVVHADGPRRPSPRPLLGRTPRRRRLRAAAPGRPAPTRGVGPAHQGGGCLLAYHLRSGFDPGVSAILPMAKGRHEVRAARNRWRDRRSRRRRRRCSSSRRGAPLTPRTATRWRTPTGSCPA